MSSPARLEILRRRRFEGDLRPRGEPRRRVPRDGAVDAHFAGLDQRLETGARERDAPRRRGQPQEAVEPLAGVLFADVEDLRPFGRNKRSEGRVLSRRFFRLDLVGLGRTSPGALLRL